MTIHLSANIKITATEKKDDKYILTYSGKDRNTEELVYGQFYVENIESIELNERK